MLMLEHRVDLVLLVQKSLFCQAFIIMYFWVVVDYMCMHAQLCLTLCNPMYCSLPGSSVYGIFQARILECCSKELRTKYWFAQQIQFVHFHIFQSQKISHFTILLPMLFLLLFQTFTCKIKLFLKLKKKKKKEYWSGLPFPTPVGKLYSSLLFLFW